MPFSLALSLREQAPVAEIESIQVQTYYMAYSEIGSEPQKWEPKTRETADHSLPYLLALAFTDGRITPDSFSDERLADPALRSLMPRIQIAENPEFTRQFPTALVSSMEVTTKDGRHLVEQDSYPRGHTRNPMTEADVETKFRQLAEGLLKPEAPDKVLDALWRFDEAKTIGGVLELLRVDS